MIACDLVATTAAPDAEVRQFGALKRILESDEAKFATVLCHNSESRCYELYEL